MRLSSSRSPTEQEAELFNAVETMGQEKNEYSYTAEHRPYSRRAVWSRFGNLNLSEINAEKIQEQRDFGEKKA